MRAGDRGMPGNAGFGRGQGEQRQARIERRIGLARVVDRGDRAVPHRAQRARVADRDERRQREAVAIVPAFADDFGPDPGRVAKRNC